MRRVSTEERLTCTPLAIGTQPQWRLPMQLMLPSVSICRAGTGSCPGCHLCKIMSSQLGGRTDAVSYGQSLLLGWCPELMELGSSGSARHGGNEWNEATYQHALARTFEEFKY